MINFSNHNLIYSDDYKPLSKDSIVIDSTSYDLQKIEKSICAEITFNDYKHDEIISIIFKLLNTSNEDRIIKILNQIMQRNELSIEKRALCTIINYILGVLYETKGDFNQALKYYDQARRTCDMSGNLDYAFQNCVLRKYRPDMSGQLDQAFQNCSVRNMVKNGLHYERSGNFPKALNMYRTIPSSFYTYNYQNTLKEFFSEEAYSRIPSSNLNSSDISNIVNIATCRRNLGEMSLAIRYFKIAAKAGESGSFLCIAKIFENMKDINKALKYYKLWDPSDNFGNLARLTDGPPWDSSER